MDSAQKKTHQTILITISCCCLCMWSQLCNKRFLKSFLIFFQSPFTSNLKQFKSDFRLESSFYRKSKAPESLFKAWFICTRKRDAVIFRYRLQWKSFYKATVRLNSPLGITKFFGKSLVNGSHWLRSGASFENLINGGFGP